MDKNHLKNQKPQIPIGSKISLKMHENCKKYVNKWKREGIKVLPAQEDKNLEKKLEENNKKITWTGSVEERKPKSFLKSFEKVKNTWKACFFKKIKNKKLSDRFSIGQKLDSIDRKSHSIDLASIKQRSSQADSNQVFYRNFDRSSNRFDRSKIWKN